MVFVVGSSVRLRLALFLLVRVCLFFKAQRRCLIGLNESIVVNLKRLQPWQGLLSLRHVFDVLTDDRLDGSFNRSWVGAGSRHCLLKSLLLDSFRGSPSSQSRPSGAALTWFVFRDTTLGFTIRRSLMGSLMRRPDLVEVELAWSRARLRSWVRLLVAAALFVLGDGPRGDLDISAANRAQLLHRGGVSSRR